MLKERLKSVQLLVGVAVGAASLVLYLVTLAPTLTWGFESRAVDGGEFLATAKVLGIPHPTGYPTYVLLLKAFTTLVPVGDFAYRGNLLSALLASASVFVLYWVTLRFCRAVEPNAPDGFAITAAALGGLTFAASPLFWSQAVVTEVYTLNALFLAALLFIATDLALQGPSQTSSEVTSITRKLALFGLLLGLGLGNHVTLVVFAAPLVYWIGSAIGWRRLASPWTFGALAAGLAVYVYLPIRSAQGPPINWGHADTIPGLVWMLTARPYQEYVFGVAAGTLVSRALEWTNLVFSQFNPLGLFLGLIGIRRLLSGEARFLASALAALALISVYAITYSTVDSEVLMIPAFLLFASWIGVGFFWIISSWIPNAAFKVGGSSDGRARVTPTVQVLVLSVLGLLLLPAVSVALNFGPQDLRNDRTAYVHASEIMDLVPDGSIVLSSRERSAFSLWYMRYVEMPGRDVAVIPAPLLAFDWYLDDIHRMFPRRVPAMSGVSSAEALRRILVHNSEGGAEVFLTFSNRELSRTYELERMGRVYRARLR